MMKEGQGINERMEKFIQILSDPDLTFMKSYQERALELYNKLNKGEVIIPLIGEFSSGKTSLINAILGVELLPVDVTPTTATINEIRFSNEEDFIEILYKDGRVERFSFTYNLKDITDDVKLIRIYSSLKLIPPNIVIVDTPGLSSLIKEHEDTIREYIPNSDAIFLAVDVNQGTLTRSTVSFLDYTSLVNVDIYIILTKADTKSERELDEVKEYIRKTYQTAKGIIITSSKLKKLDEFYSLLKMVESESSKTLVNSVSRKFFEISVATCDFLKDHFNNLFLDLNDLNKKIKEIEYTIFTYEKELMIRVNNLRTEINNAMQLAIDELSRLLDSSIDYIVDVYFTDLDGSQNKFHDELDKIIRSSIEQAIHFFSRTIKVKLENFEKEIMDFNFQFHGNISSTIRTTLHGINEILKTLILDIVIPGGILHALVANLILKLLTKIPFLRGVKNIDIISPFVSMGGKLVFKGHIRNDIRQKFAYVIDDFSFQIKRGSIRNVESIYISK